MNTQISDFYWNANKDNCIAVINYYLQGSAIAEDNSWHNNACPSAIVTIADSSDVYEVFFPTSPMDMDMCGYDKFHLFISNDGEEEPIATYDTIGELITFFKSVI
jgi:hypothetical protein